MVLWWKNLKVSKSYSEDDLLPISALQHLSYCPRQFVLIHMERIWRENVLTAQGRVLHDKAHDPYISEKRGDIIISRAMPLISYSLGVFGEADVVEFHAAAEGIEIAKRSGKWLPVPVEYKKGKSKTEPHDRVQLCAQAICLEEMLNANINTGYLYYWEVRSREKVELDSIIRKKTYSVAEEMHHIYANRLLPNAQKAKKQCRKCSLFDDCLPILAKAENVAHYIDRAFGDLEDVL